MLNILRPKKIFKYIYLILPLSLILIPSTNGCMSGTSKFNVIEVDCRKNSTIEKVPNTPNIITRTSFCSDYMFEKNSLSLAINLFVKEYSSHFKVSEEEVWSMISGLEIEVSIIPRTVHAAYDVNGNFLKGDVPVNGLALSKNHIWVEAKTSQIWSSALVHEMVHIIIWRKNKVHGDPDHEGGEFSGWTSDHTLFIKKMKNIFLDMEL